MRHHHFALRQPVRGGQQPTAELLFDGVVSVAGRRLADLRDQRLRVAQQHLAQRPGVGKAVRQWHARQPVGVAAALHHGRAGAGVATQKQLNADHPLKPHASAFDHLAVLGHLAQRDHGGGGKVDMAQGLARLTYRLAQHHWDQFEIGCQGAQFGDGQASQQAVLTGAVGG